MPLTMPLTMMTMMLLSMMMPLTMDANHGASMQVVRGPTVPTGRRPPFERLTVLCFTKVFLCPRFNPCLFETFPGKCRRSPSALSSWTSRTRTASTSAQRLRTPCSDSTSTASSARRWYCTSALSPHHPSRLTSYAPRTIELELELIHTQMTQKPMLRVEVGARALRNEIRPIKNPSYYGK